MTPPITGYAIYDPVDPFENHSGPFFWAERDGIQHFALRTEARHCNSHGIVHGGLMMTMIDLTMNINAKSAPDERFVTVSMNSEFVASATAGDLIEARADLVRRTRSLAFVRGQVNCGERTLLTASAVLKPLSPR